VIRRADHQAEGGSPAPDSCLQKELRLVSRLQVCDVGLDRREER
jgi:hypothetical protein